MSLHQLANHMSARGRGPDSMLVHMTPREVAGLQSLAVANGTSLTINPDTGLPEAFSLKDLLPTLAGAAINYFAPGFGTAIGGALGLSGAAGTGLAVGAATAALSGDLGKGLSAGLGAYGGAGITQGLMGLGTGALSAEAGKAAIPSGMDALGYEAEQLSQNAIASKLASSGKFDTLSAGASKAMNDPMSAIKTVGGGSTGKGLALAAAALSPLLAGETGNTVQTVTQRRLPRPKQPSVYDNMSQTFERYAANGGLMGLAHGGAVHYEGGGPVGAAAAPFDGDAWLRNYIATNYSQPATPVVTNTNAGSGFAATTAATNNTAANTAATNTAATNNTFDAGGGFAATPTPVATAAAPVAETAPLAAAQVFPQEASGIAALSQAPVKVAETAPMALNNALTNMGAGTGMSVQDAAMKVLGRQLSPTELSNWNASIGSDDVTAAELSKFSIAAQPERALGINNTNDAIRQMYLDRLGRYPDASGLAYFSDKFGTKVDADERKIFNAMTTEEFEANVERDKANLPKVVTDLTTAATNYIAPGVGGSTGAGQVGGGTTVNPNGTITTSPRIPGIPVGGFSGMTDVKRTYTDSGGDLGYTSPTYTATAFADKYKNTGSQKEMYDYLMGKGDRPTKTKNADGTFREISRPYNEAVLGVPGSTNKRLTWNKTKGEYDRNPDYVHRTKVLDLDKDGKKQYEADGKTVKTTPITYMSTNAAKAALAKTKLTKDSGITLAEWAIDNKVQEQSLADIYDIPLETVKGIFADYQASLKPAKNGGLMQLANGGMTYSFGGGVRSEYVNAAGETRVWDRSNGMYRPKTLVKDGKSYTWDTALDNYKLTGADAATGIASLMDMSGGSNAGDARGPGTGTTTPIENNGFFSSILGRTTQPASPVESRTENTPQQTFRAAELNAQNAKNIADMNKQTHIDLTTEYERTLQAADEANKAEQAQRDAITSANSPTATGGRANSPGIAALGVDPATGLAPGELSNREPVTTTLSDRISAAADRARASQAVRAADDRDARDIANAQADADAAALADFDARTDGGNYSGVIGGGVDAGGVPDGSYSGSYDFAHGGMAGYAQGGLGSLGGYSDGGRLLRGPGDGVSDSIPASIGDRQPARLADGEFVVPARIVSELGNGSTEAGARALYKMMARIQANRRKTTGKNSVAVDSKAHKYLPA